MSKDHVSEKIDLPKLDKELEGPQQEDNDEEISCRTPTSRDHQIPTIKSCPPTPRKQPRAFLQKRKWTETLHFFETTRREELESFFRSSFEFPRVAFHAAAKRRCTSV
ncbi:hypothetical protein I3760_13G142700 [Carya illinoinensis]|nr:hypothetical protein I3760_13G142700 [Carya illinoinensis]